MVVTMMKMIVIKSALSSIFPPEAYCHDPQKAPVTA